MLTKKFILQLDPVVPVSTQDLEKRVWDAILEWHYGDGLQEAINMMLPSYAVPAGVVKVGGSPDTIKFMVQPFPSPYKPWNKPSPYRR